MPLITSQLPADVEGGFEAVAYAQTAAHCRVTALCSARSWAVPTRCFPHPASAQELPCLAPGTHLALVCKGFEQSHSSSCCSYWHMTQWYAVASKAKRRCQPTQLTTDAWPKVRCTWAFPHSPPQECTYTSGKASEDARYSICVQPLPGRPGSLSVLGQATCSQLPRPAPDA